MTRHSWERSLGKKDVSIFLELWKANFPRLNDRAIGLNAVAGEMILNGMHAYGWTNDALSNTPSRLRDALLHHCPTLLNHQGKSLANIPNDAATQVDVGICASSDPPSNLQGLAGSRGPPLDPASGVIPMGEEPMLMNSWNESFPGTLPSTDSWVNTDNSILDTIQANDYLSTDPI